MVPGALCANRSGTRIVKNPRKWCTNLIENTVICLVTRRRDWGETLEFTMEYSPWHVRKVPCGWIKNPRFDIWKGEEETHH